MHRPYSRILLITYEIGLTCLTDPWMGLISDDGIYYIQPYHDGNITDNDTSVPHIMYRHQDRIVPSENNSHCAMETKENYKHWKRKSYDSEMSMSYYNASSSHHRQKRSISAKRYVEVMVVADHKMKEYYHDELQEYVLTLMAIVTSIYRDHTIGNFISIVLVKLVILDSPQAGPEVSTNAASTLRAFCKWQHQHNVDDDKSILHYDTAVLLTRVDICRAPMKCDTLGLAELGTMCDKYRSCSVIEDNGLSAAFTIAHELGHVFKLPHDDDVKCQQFRRHPGAGYQVMAPTLDDNTNPWTWSGCSAKLLTDFIDAGKAECLLDKPQQRKYQKLLTPAHLTSPGELFNVSRQCELVFGNGSVICPYMAPCKKLWCTNRYGESKGCRSQYMPWADGTPCSQDGRKWCKHGRCVQRVIAVAVRGGWGGWQSYGDCSRDCGGGVRSALRRCDRPTPRSGGRYCVGKRVRYKSCNTKSCALDTPDFREHQCAKFNGKRTIKGLPPDVKWVPKYSGIQLKDMCKLFCRATSSSAFYLLQNKVTDGTKCDPHTTDLCVNGKCCRAGCDNKLGSKMKRDNCGVCGGDNSSCRTVSNTFNNVTYGYHFVVTIPIGATNIIVEQHGYNNRKDDDTYLALKDANNNYVLNGNSVVSFFRKRIKLAGVFLDYSGSDNVVESINGTQLLMEEINIWLLSVGKLYPPDVRYTYTISVGENVRFLWKVDGPWDDCDNICQGRRRMKVLCVRHDDGAIVSEQRCEDQRKPFQISKKCNTDCTVNWDVFLQSECSQRCSVGLLSQQVHCIKKRSTEHETVADKYCLRIGTKPASIVACQGDCLPTHWQYTEWSQCSRSCGGGERYRQAVCVDTKLKELQEADCSLNDQVLRQACNQLQCAQWQTEEWTGCSATCGQGNRHRKVWCRQGDDSVDDALCDPIVKPVSKQACHLDACPVWYPGGWGPCSGICGKGEARRLVRCRFPDGEYVKDLICDPVKKPVTTQSCSLPPCTTTTSQILQAIQPHVSNAKWGVGSWAHCSVTCGEGMKQRYVTCMGSKGNLPDSHCSRYGPRPAEKERCRMKPCGQWRSGEWGECTASCGEGVETRYVACIMPDNRMGGDKDCEEPLKPDVTRPCNIASCNSRDKQYNRLLITNNMVDDNSHWRVGHWSACSSSCGQGWQRRQVVCQGEKGASYNCSKRDKPKEMKTCNSGPCPRWSYGEWGQCSRSCGGGYKIRAIRCQLYNGQSLPDGSCNILERPPVKQLCNAGRCVAIRTWKTPPYSPCSVTCGQGRKQREVVCVDSYGSQWPPEECPKKKPRNLKRCWMKECPHWVNGPWTQCSVSCGKGTRRREVDCQMQYSLFVSAELCKGQKKPRSTETCVKPKCSDYNWKKSDWSQCSKTCGFGQKTRIVVCVDRLTVKVSSHLCDTDTRPKIRRRCSEYPCPYIWNTGHWTECSARCGDGTQTRTIVCQAVSKEAWVMPGEAPNGCKRSERPPNIRYCNYGACNSQYRWRPGPWGGCSVKCGTGTQRRQVICTDQLGKRHPRRNCVSAYKPHARRSCYNGPCYARTCKELKDRTSIRQNGDYHLVINGRQTKIYCHKMKKSMPTEYLTLVARENENFSEVYPKRLKRPGTCPNNGTQSSDCPCRQDVYREHGYSKYSKLRLIIKSLTVDSTDTTYSKSTGAKRIPFATAGDCYSLRDCPQGQFHINLSGTGFRMSSNSTWRSVGNHVVQRITLMQDGEVVEGSCGGYCGKCTPDGPGGLQLELST